jgi:hypothetical protein
VAAVGHALAVAADEGAVVNDAVAALAVQRYPARDHAATKAVADEHRRPLEPIERIDHRPDVIGVAHLHPVVAGAAPGERRRNRLHTGCGGVGQVVRRQRKRAPQPGRTAAIPVDLTAVQP